ncbi:MAG: TRAP transporter small permease [Pseudomonadota bacterium]
MKSEEERPEARLDGAFDRLSGYLGYLYFACVAAIGYEVIARYIFGAPTVWVHELTVMLVGVCFALGGVVVAYDRAHISITILYDTAGPGLRRAFDLLIAVVSSTYLLLLSYAGWVVAAQAWKLGERSGTAWNPPLPMVLKSALFASAALMAVIALVHLVLAVRRLAVR